MALIDADSGCYPVPGSCRNLSRFGKGSFGFAGGLDGVVAKRLLPVHIYGSVRAFLILFPKRKKRPQKVSFLAVNFDFKSP